jgi:hypothetical protein
MPKVTIYSDISGVPHTFLGITGNNGIEKRVGFAPEKPGIFGRGVINDDSRHEFQYFYDMEITDEQYTKLMKRIEADESNPPFYNLPVGAQCTVWAMDVLGDAGIINRSIAPNVKIKDQYIDFYSNIFGDEVGKVFGETLGSYVGYVQTIVHNPYT